MRKKHQDEQSDSSSSSNSAPESGPPPPLPILNEMDIDNGHVISRPSLHRQSCRPRLPSKELTRDESAASAVNHNSNNNNDLSVLDKPDSTGLPSDEYPSAINDDYFSQLLESFGGDHEISDQDHDLSMSPIPHSMLMPRTKTGPSGNALNFDDPEQQSSSFASSMDLQPLLPGPSSQELFATSGSLFGTSSSTSQSNDLSSEDDCECTSSALKVLEVVAAPLKGTDRNTVERKLCFLKRTLTQCIDLSRCSSCTQDSGFTMLVLVLYDKITATFEETAQWWKRNLTQPAREESGRAIQPPCMAFGRYQIDTIEEHGKVLATLLLLQLHRLVSLVSATRRSITSSKCETQLTLLTVLSHRLQAVQVTLNG